MKFVLVTINLETIPGRNRMNYPKVYNAQEVEIRKKGPLQYDGGIGRGESTEELLIYLQNETADKYAEDIRIRIITDAEANTWLSKCKRLEGSGEERVTDPNRMLAIIAKNAAGVALSQEDLDALNPDNKIAGINRKRKNITDMYGV